MAITAPLIPAFFGACGGILGGYVGLLSLSFGNVMLVSDSKWIIIDKEYGKIYDKAKIFYKNGDKKKVKNLEFLNDKTIEFSGSDISYDLADISQIQVKKGRSKKFGKISSRCCGCSWLLLFSQPSSDGYSVPAETLVISTALVYGITYTLGWLTGSVFDEWYVIYNN